MASPERDEYVDKLLGVAGRLRGWFLRGAGEDAEDLVQVVMMNAMRNEQRFEDRGQGSFERWVFAIARNVLIDWRAGRRRRRERATTEAVDQTAISHAAEPDGDPVGLAVWRALSELSARDRSLIQAIDLDPEVQDGRCDSLSQRIAEVARRRGEAESTVRTRFYRARSRLERCLRRQADLRVTIKRLEEAERRKHENTRRSSQ